MEQELHSRIKAERAMAPSTLTSATTTDGIKIDTAGFESIEYIINTGTIAASGVATFVLEESDVNTFGGEETVVPAAETHGAVSIVEASDDRPLRCGSSGKKRWQRLTMVTTTTNSVEIENAVAILGHPRNAPVADQNA